MVYSRGPALACSPTQPTEGRPVSIDAATVREMKAKGFGPTAIAVGHRSGECLSVLDVD
jgi:hypothetical protein